MNRIVAKMMVLVVAMTTLGMPVSASEPEQVIFSQCGIYGMHDYNGRTYLPTRRYVHNEQAVTVGDAATGEVWGNREITDEKIVIEKIQAYCKKK